MPALTLASSTPSLRDPARHGTWHRFRLHRPGYYSLWLLIVLALLLLLAPFLYRAEVHPVDFHARLAGPGLLHPLGTDDLGRDLLARILYGGRISIGVGLVAMSLAVGIGVVVGAVAGISRGWTGTALMWLTDLFLCLPQLPLLLVLVFFFREPLKNAFGLELGIFLLIVMVIAGLRWMPVARLVRAQFLSLREKEFVQAARALGASVPRQVLHHLLPNAMGPVIVAGTIDVAAAVIAESTLSFLGLGFPSDVPSWGRLLYEARDYLDVAPHWALAPGIAIAGTVLAVNLVGDGAARRTRSTGAPFTAALAGHDGAGTALAMVPTCSGYRARWTDARAGARRCPHNPRPDSTRRTSVRALVVNDRFTRRPVVPDMVSMIAGMRLVAAVTGADLAMSWLAVHAQEWDVAIVTVEHDPALLEVIAFARAANPEAKIVAFGSIVAGEIRAECLRCGADAAFSSRQSGDLAAWLDGLRSTDE